MIGSAVQGGQIAAHNFRMTSQVVKTSILIAVTSTFSYLLYQASYIPLFYWKAGFYHLLASTFKTSSIPVDGKFWGQLTNHTLRSGKIHIPAKQLFSSTSYYSTVEKSELRQITEAIKRGKNG